MPYFAYKGKACHYSEAGQGKPLVFLHGNTASSKMFLDVVRFYQDSRRVILIDFLGHGKSQRLDRFPVDLWFDEAMQVIAFLEQKQIGRADLIGSSGGALVALNVALERPGLVGKVIADSFEGERPLKDFIVNIKTERAASKTEESSRAFYRFNHGEGWEQVVDNDTNALFEHSRTIGTFFHKPLITLESEVLLTGSRADEFVTEDFYRTTYTELLLKIKRGRMVLFEQGGHPAMLSNGEAFSHAALDFLDNGDGTKE